MNNWHTTTADERRVAWTIHDGQPHVRFVDNPTSTAPAMRWPDDPMPAMRRGHISFPAPGPTIAAARELLAQCCGSDFDAVLDAAADEYNAAALDYAIAGPGARAHRSFFEANSPV